MDLVFNDRSDTSRKLHNCVGVYENVPVSIQVDMGVADVNTIRVKTIPNGRVKTIQTDDPSFEARFMPQGYMNYQNRAIWITRTPQRRMQLGISDENLMFRAPDNEPLDIRVTIIGQEYVDLYNDKYPPYDEAIKNLMSNRETSCAISREVALGWLDYPGAIRLYYRNVPVGVITPKRKEKNPIVNLYDTEFQSFIMTRLRNSGIPYVQAA